MHILTDIPDEGSTDRDGFERELELDRELQVVASIGKTACGIGVVIGSYVFVVHFLLGFFCRPIAVEVHIPEIREMGILLTVGLHREFGYLTLGYDIEQIETHIEVVVCE